VENKIHAFFSPLGPLAQTFVGYEMRPSQLVMAQQIASVFKTKGFNFIEAATGIGKTFAYLVPSLFQALERGQKIIISTYTIALQEQLFYKDLPLLLDLLGIQCGVALVKGMGNYLCHEKFYKLKKDPAFFKHPFTLALEEKFEEPQEGCYENFASILPKEHWTKLTADPASCLAHTCPSYKNCFFFNARKPVDEAQILIVNHHLLLTDLMMKETMKEASLLPPAHHLIVDEAHHLPEIAEELFSKELSMNGLIAKLKTPLHPSYLDSVSKALHKQDQNPAVHFLQTTLPILIDEIIEAFSHCLDLGASKLTPQNRYILLKEPDEALFELFKTGQFLLRDLSSQLATLLHLLKEFELYEKYRTAVFLLEKIQKEAEQIESILALFQEKQEDKLLFFEKTPYHTAFYAHFLNAPQTLAQSLTSHYLSSTFCSATLTFDGAFENFQSAMGFDKSLHSGSSACYDSEFDYKQAMLFAIPSDMPEPSSPDYEIKLFEFCLNVIQATQGGVFILFTSYDQLYKFADKIQKNPFLDKISLQIQGTDSKQKLLEAFKASSHSVLLGTDSFWEGVDVQGEKLRCVILTKLPFRAPNDPLFQATCQKLREAKKDPFFEKALPEACIKFKQGLGRLIRSKEDFGVVVCTDIRLMKKNYGQYFLKMLPPCERKLATSHELIPFIKQKIHHHQNRLKIKNDMNILTKS